MSLKLPYYVLLTTVTQDEQQVRVVAVELVSQLAHFSFIQSHAGKH